jgi:hypothetical protein
VLELDPGLCGVIERAQVEIVDAVEHFEQSSFNGTEEGFLLAVPKTKSQAAVVCVLHYEQSESSSAPKRYRQAKETKRGGMGGQKSVTGQAPIFFRRKSGSTLGSDRDLRLVWSRTRKRRFPREARHVSMP